MSFAEKIFGTFSDRELKKINPLTKKVLALEPQYQAMSDADLQAQTPALKERLAKGETLDDILPDAFAVCREAAWRVLGMKHFPVQITGGIALHRGDIAEMQTGEGKTLVATLPAYLNALTGEGVHIVTVNDYLAKRDSEWMGKLYRWRQPPPCLQCRYHLRHQQRVRLRLPARQHGDLQGQHGAARPCLRHRR